MTSNIKTENNWLKEVQVYFRAGKLTGAVDYLDLIIKKRPGDATPHYYRGLACQGLGRREDAAASYEQAVMLNPALAEAFNNLGSVQLSGGFAGKAVENFKRAIASRGDLIPAHYNLGLALKNLGDASASLQKFIDVLELDPKNVDAFDNALNLCYANGWVEKRLELFTRYENSLKPSIELYLAGLGCCRYLADAAMEQRYIDKVLEHDYKAGEERKLSEALGKIQYFDVSQESILGLYRKFDALMRQGFAAPFPLVLPLRTSGSKIRVGYLSPDFRSHVMGRLMWEVLSRHDASAFEVYCYSLLPEQQEDDLSRKFRESSHKFLVVESLSAFDTAKLIANDDLDILVDLGAHSTSSRPEILSYKPARVVITHLGYHGSVGLDKVDFKLTDKFADTPENQQFLLEKLLPMEGCVFPFHRIDVNEQSISRESLGIKEDAVVIGIFANIMKFSPRQMACWREILKRADKAIVAFSPFFEDEKSSLMRQAALLDIGPDRVVFIPSFRNEAANRARYKVVDMVLDTFPYGGGDTTLAALDMRAPVVTLIGQRQAERASYSILMNLGVQQIIASNEKEFIEIACRLAKDAEFRGEVRERIQYGLQNSGLADNQAYVANLENAYLRALAEKGLSTDAACPVSALEFFMIFNKAVMAHQDGKFAEAGEGYRNALDAQPDYVPALLFHGKLLAESGHLVQAAAAFDKVIAICPGHAHARQSLNEIHRKMEGNRGAV